MRCLFRYILLILFFIPYLSWAQWKDDRAINKLEAEIEETNKQTRKLFLLHQLAKEYNSFDTQKAVQIAQEAHDLALSLNTPDAEAFSLNELGNLYLQQEKPEQAQTYYQRALGIAETHELKTELFSAYNGMSQANLAMAQNAEALEFAKEAEKYLQFPEDAIQIYLTYGNLYAELRDYPEAEERFNTARVMAVQSNNYDLIAQAASASAEFYAQKNDFEEANKHAQTAKEMAARLDNPRQLVKALLTAGDINAQNEDTQREALQEYMQAYVIALEYDFGGNSDALKQAIDKIEKTYQQLAQQDELKNAEEAYDRLAKDYAERVDLLASVNGNIPRFREKMNNRAAGGDTKIIYRENDKNRLANIEKQRSDLIVQAQNDQISMLEEARKQAELQAEEDQIRIKELEKEVADWKEKDAANQDQIKELEETQGAHDKELSQAKIQKWWWILPLLLLLLLILIWAFLRNRRSREKITEQNQKLIKKEDDLHTANVFLSQREKEVAEKSALLEEAKLESEGLTDIIENDLQPPLSQLLIHSREEELNRVLIHQSGKNMLNLMTNVLDIQKYPDAELQLYKKPNSLYHTALRAYNQMSELFEEKNIQVENRISPAFRALFDMAVIERVFLSLLENALKYTPEGGKVTLETQAKQMDNETLLETTVSDNGQIISQDSLAKVYEKFAPKSARPSGLGLVFVKTVIEAHNGEVAVHSNSQEGTQFLFTLPALTETDEKIPQEPEATDEELRAEFTFSEADLKFLAPFLEELKQMEFYETSKLNNLLNRLSTNGSDSIARWKKAVEETIYLVWEERFKQLMRIAS